MAQTILLISSVSLNNRRVGAILLIGPVWLAYIAQKQEALGENYESVTDFSDVSLCETCSSDYVPGYLNMDIVVREALVLSQRK